MDHKRKERLLESMRALDQEVREALLAEDMELFHYHLLRAYRLNNKVSGLKLDQHSDNQLNVQSQFYQYLKSWHQQAAQYYEGAGQYEEAKREWLGAISFLKDDLDPEPHIQYAHAELLSQNIKVSRDIKDLMPYISKHNVKDIQLSLRKAKFSLKTASANNGLTDALNYMIGWIDQLQKAIDEREDLTLVDVAETDGHVNDILLELDGFIGLVKVKQKVREICNLVAFNKLRQEKGFKVEPLSLHMIFTGNPGTGKTTIARIVARVLKALGVLKKGHLVEAGRSDLVAEYVGQTAVKTMGKIKEARDGVLFIDEAYSLVRSEGNDFGIEAIDTIVKEMEDKREELVIILAGYPNEMNRFILSNPGLQSRFKNQILFEDYSIGELMAIAKFMLKQRQFRLTGGAEQIFRRIVADRVQMNPDNHGNARLVRNLIEESILSKANLVVSNQELGIHEGELDVIDETIMRMVDFNMLSSNELKGQVRDKVQQPKGVI